MAKRLPGHSVDRRTFLTGVAVAGAATMTDLSSEAAAKAPIAPSEPAKPSALPPSARVAVAELEAPRASGHAIPTPTSDFMVDVIKTLDIDYVASNPANSFRGLHESLLNHGGNKKPEFLTCMHEESSVAIAHGYFKIAGKPMMALCHGTVGLQHASMAIYNAWCDRVPIVIIGGNDLDAAKRPPFVPTYHSAQDIGALVRDFTKWDDMPMSAQHFAESFVRAYKLAMTAPYEPVLISLDSGLQEEPLGDRGSLKIPRYVPTAPPQGDSGAVSAAAKLLANAQNPVIVADRLARTPNGIKLLVELAETLNVPVIDRRSRLNFPTTHYLHQTGRGKTLIANADVILGLELSDFYGTVNAYIDNGENLRESKIKPGTKLISIGAGDYYLKSNYQDFQRFQPVDISIAGDAEATMPALIEAVKSGAAGRPQGGHRAARRWSAQGLGANACTHAEGGDLCLGCEPDQHRADVRRDLGADQGRGLVPGQLRPHASAPGRAGCGRWRSITSTSADPAASASATACRPRSAPRSPIAPRGASRSTCRPTATCMYAPGVLWTAAHHRIPLLNVMHNNRGYHQEVMHVQRMADRRNRVLNDGPIGTQIIGPNIDYAKLAQSMGWWASGPISDPKDLAPALKRAVQVVKAGEPALVDVVTQPR